MKRIRKRLSYANVMASIAVFLLLGGATAVAKKVGTKQLKAGSVTAGKIKKNAVTAAKIRNKAVTTAKIKNDAVTGQKVLESSLATVPDAAALGGLPAGSYATKSEFVTFRVPLAFGEIKTIVSNGPVSLQAECRANVSGVQDEIRILGATTQSGSFMQGDTPNSGPGLGGTFLEPGTEADKRVMSNMVSTVAGDGQPAADDDIDTGFVAGPAAEYIGMDETTMLAINVAGSNCLVVGHAVLK